MTMQFQTPQFIETENKIIGPLTLKQFFYLAIGFGVSFVFFFLLNSWLWFLISLIVGVIAVSFAFIKINGQPLPIIFLRAFLYFWQPRLYIWERKAENKTFTIPEIPDLPRIPEAASVQLVSAEVRRVKLKKFFGETPTVKKLWQDLMTTKTPIPRREKTLRMPEWQRGPKESFQIFRKMTGERGVARRVDYR
ncbi:PrgI family protein [Candidatus Wolfebacteria bacterium]|nr:PrgI family protein [Candidatus Wolfebacteria bacterium]